MKKGFLKLVKGVLAPGALVIAMAAFSPVAALAANRGGGHAGGFNGGHAFSAPARGNFNRGNAYGGGRAYYGGHFAGPRYYGPGFGFGVGVYAPYGYSAPVCNPAGFYDQAGFWHYYPGCAPYGY